jgi:hypothetical protein
MFHHLDIHNEFAFRSTIIDSSSCLYTVMFMSIFVNVIQVFAAESLFLIEHGLDRVGLLYHLILSNNHILQFRRLEITLSKTNMLFGCKDQLATVTILWFCFSKKKVQQPIVGVLSNAGCVR